MLSSKTEVNNVKKMNHLSLWKCFVLISNVLRDGFIMLSYCRCSFAQSCAAENEQQFDLICAVRFSSLTFAVEFS